MLRHRGFTLIEVMITVVIIAILAAIAIPSYRDYVIRGALPEAFSVLAGQRVKMEQFFQDNRTYEGACDAGTVATLPAATDRFTFSCDPEPDATTYTITATGNAGTAAAGFTFTIDQSNVRTTDAVPTGWTEPAGNCWVVRKDGSC
ncbi:MAG: prepilin-type N-terminal cleavage/methylation domain-containing protein [Burkholderiales bacterium]|nr:prepilin-type N-terminal cleavage/methylation domain-containing protein [Burkholderiales bacterium]